MLLERDFYDGGSYVHKIGDRQRNGAHLGGEEEEK
jgi:hypothetical protein